MDSKLTADRIPVADSIEAVTELFLEKGWGDGLPIVPPTENAVLKMLTGTARDPAEIIATIPPKWGEATVEKIAINAVMAGCLPEYMPLLITAVAAMCEEKVNLRAIQPTTHPVAPLLLVNGPVAKQLKINSRAGAFGPGWRANATIGRAIRLMLLNIGGAIPGVNDMATQGQPSKYSFCVAENEEANPWEPLHVERGFAASVSTVTVVGCESPHNINDHCGITAEELLSTVATVMSNTGNNNVLLQDSEPVLALGPEHAATIAASGFSKSDVKAFIHENARVPLQRFHERAIQRYFPSWDRNSLVPLTPRKEDLIVIVIGGVGKHSLFLPALGHGHSVTMAII